VWGRADLDWGATVRVNDCLFVSPTRHVTVGAWARIGVHVIAALFAPISGMSPQGGSPQTLAAGSLLSASREGFTRIVAVRELKSGDLLLVEAAEQRVARITWPGGTVSWVGRVGAGPLEYRTPRALIAAAGDSTWVTDPAGLRVLVLDPDGQPARSFLLAQHGGGPGPLAGMHTFQPRAGDSAGGVHERGAAVAIEPNGRTRLIDSSPIVRLDVSARRRDTVAWIPEDGTLSRELRPGTAQVLVQPGPLQPLASASDWSVSARGTIAVVTPAPYRVTYVNGSSRTVGPTLSVIPVVVDDEEKRRWAHARADAAAGRRGAVGNLARGTLAPRAGGALPDRPVVWPRYYPAFLPGSLLFDSAERLWVRRAGPSNAPVLYDVLDARGRRIAEFRLESGSRVLAVTDRYFYVGWKDDDDLEWVRRYSAPTVVHAP